MPDKRTVIVAGAGCSAEFGLPTGKALTGLLRNEKAGGVLGGYNQYRDVFSKGFSLFMQSSELNREHSRFGDFLSDARHSFADSIDLFAYYNPSYSAVAILYSTWGILKHFYELKADTARYDKPEILYRKAPWLNPITNGSVNWIGKLVAKFLEGHKSFESLDGSRLSFITFNYDTIIEESFGTYVRSQERFKDIQNSQLPSVHHVYGQFPPLPDQLRDAEPINAASKAIRYINDVNQNDESVLRIRELITTATEIYIVGFDMDPLNVELIQLDRSRANKVALAYDANDRLLARLARIGISGNRTRVGSFKDPLSIGAAASRGFFDLAELLP